MCVACRVAVWGVRVACGVAHVRCVCGLQGSCVWDVAHVECVCGLRGGCVGGMWSAVQPMWGVYGL